MKNLCQILLVASLAALVFTAKGQNASGCGTEITPQQMAGYRSLVKQAQANNAAEKMSAIVYIPVVFHIIRRNDGTGFNGLSLEDQLAECDAALDTVNQRYKGAELQFYRCQEPDYIMNSMFYDSINVGSATQQAFIAANFNPSVINVYFTRRVLSSTGSNRCGWARFPTDSERWVIMNYGCLDDRNTFAHEMGHYFGLLHTHETAYGAEGVTRTSGAPCYNCGSTGDLLCDTPADPTLQLNDGSFIVDGNCNYTGTAMDACNIAYAPDTRNIMSYTIGSCGNHFSAGQLNVIVQAYNNTRQAQLDNSVCNQTMCLEDFVLPNVNVTASKKVNAQMTITSMEVIMTPPSEDVQYDAGTAIFLKPGFHAQSGTRFHAFIDGCYIPPFAPSSSDERAPKTDVLHQQGQNWLQVMPNPTAGETWLTVLQPAGGKAVVSLINAQGQLVQTWELPPTEHTTTQTLRFDASQLTPGLYLCLFQTDAGSVFRAKVVVTSK